ncbi:MAG: sugar phosphate isomerase/epimerase [Chloroflexi bacterium]|nr:sugar phosphate isomerase/epimerase [Chloroflexota bacterium]
MLGAPVALQLYTVRDDTARDFAQTVRQVAAIGYAGVEFAGYGGLKPSEVRELMDETGLQPVSTHVNLEILENDLTAAGEAAALIGCRYVVLSGLPQDRRTPQALRDLTPRLNDVGRHCQTLGIRFGYHNHDWEFAGASGSYLLDNLLDGTDPELVALELDVYWAAFAGVDPIGYIQQRTGRVPLVHVKDLAHDRSFTEVGDGTLDMPAILGAARQFGSAEWYIVENDQPRNGGLESARRSLENIRAFGAV